MAYTINKFNGEPLIVLEDGTIDTSTSLGLVGRNYVGYGETQNENFVFLLENFANDAPPSRPIAGQVWYDTANNVLNSYNGTAWLPVGNAVKSDNAPDNPGIGQLWLKNNEEKQLFVYDGTNWELIGPGGVDGFSTTRAVSMLWKDISGNSHPIIALTVNGNIQSIVSYDVFQWRYSDQELAVASTDTFVRSMYQGINMLEGSVFVGTLNGNAATASRFETGRTINGVYFDGSGNITIKSSTTNRLVRGSYLTGNNFDGSTEQTWGVNATSENNIGTVVARNSAGGFSAGLITADLAGNVTISTGKSTFNDIEAVEVRATRFVGATLTGNAFSATRLATARTINGVSFNGTADITVPAAAGTLTGATLNGTVVNSNLQAVGLLRELFVENTGITVGTNLQLFENESGPAIKSNTDRLTVGIGSGNLIAISSTLATGQGWDAVPTLYPAGSWNLGGKTTNKFNKIYATEFNGNATNATLAVNANHLTGGATGSIPYQSLAGITNMLPIGLEGQVLKVGGSNTIQWATLANEPLTASNYVVMKDLAGNPIETYDSNSQVLISVDATTTNTGGKVVARDSTGNFAAGTITANLTGNTTGTHTGPVIGNVTGNVVGNVTGNLTGTASDNVRKAGDTMTNFLTLHANPVQPLHAATKQYVDSQIYNQAPAIWAGSTTPQNALATYVNFQKGTILSLRYDYTYTYYWGNGAGTASASAHYTYMKTSDLPDVLEWALISTYSF